MTVVYNTVLNVVRVIRINWCVVMSQEDMGINSSIILNGLMVANPAALIKICVRVRIHIHSTNRLTYLGSRNLNHLFTLIVVVTPRDILGVPYRFSVVVGKISIFRGVDSEIHRKSSSPQWQKCFRKIGNIEVSGGGVVKDTIGKNRKVVGSDCLLLFKRCGSWSSHIRLSILGSLLLN